jgi:hypothetical protein
LLLLDVVALLEVTAAFVVALETLKACTPTLGLETPVLCARDTPLEKLVACGFCVLVLEAGGTIVITDKQVSLFV